MNGAEERKIEKLVCSQFEALAWEEGGEADWHAFRAGFVPETTLFPAARPLRPQTVPAFIDRMADLAVEGTLRTFSERPLGIKIMRFENVAVALAGCEMLENGTTITRDVSAFLLVKDGDEWFVASQAWDAAPEGATLPTTLAALLQT